MRIEDLQTLSPREDRRAGAVLGLAVGDALGSTYEFRTPDDVPEGPLEMAGGGRLDWAPGDTTDDTDLTRAVLEGYRDGPFDLRRVRDAMVRWLETEPKDVGNQTRKALGHLRRHPDALSVPEEPSAQGNGTVMRAAAHGIKSGTPEQAAKNAWTEAGLTHPSWEARASSALVAVIVERLIGGNSPHEALEAAYSLVESRNEVGKSVRDVFRVSDVSEDYVRDSGRLGWTVYTTRLALHRLVEARDFRSGVESVVRLAGDSDTNGAVAGALLGARFGASRIPGSWLRDLKGKRELLFMI